jgi:alpha-galactosidase
VKKLIGMLALAAAAHAQMALGNYGLRFSPWKTFGTLPQAGIVAFYDFADLRNQPKARDTLGSGLDFTWVSSGASIGTPIWQAWGATTGAPDFVQPAGLQAKLAGKPATFVAVIRSAFLTGNPIVGAQKNTSPYSGWIFYGNSQAPSFQSNGVWCGANTTITDNQWHVVVATISGSTLKYYVDGVPDSKVCNGEAALTSWTDPLGVGALFNPNGTLSTVASQATFDIAGLGFAARAWSAGEVAQYQQMLAAMVNKPYLAPVAAYSYTTVPANGLGTVPIMGYSTWYDAGAGITEAHVKAVADAMVSNGMKAAGYNYVNIDDAHSVRTADGVWHLNPTQFPSGLKAVCDYIHADGLKCGVYSSPGATTCGAAPGSYLYEAGDAAAFAAGGADYLKYDWCSASGSYGAWPGIQDNWQRYAYQTMGQALQATGRAIVYAPSQYGQGSVSTWGKLTGANSARSYWDVAQYGGSNGINYAFDNPGPANAAGPGFFWDPDNLRVGDSSHGFTDDAGKQQMSLWAILAAPLIEGQDITTLSSNSLATLLNTSVIAVDQDPLGIQGVRVSHTACGSSYCDVFARKITGTNTCAVGLFNRDSAAHSISVTWAAVAAVVPACGGLSSYTNVQDLWATWPACAGGAGHDCAGTPFTAAGGYTAPAVSAYGAVMLRVAP